MKKIIFILILLFSISNVSYGYTPIVKKMEQPNPMKKKKKQYNKKKRKLQNHQKRNIRRSGGDLTKYKC
jgi:uncharacterized protein YxeA